MPAYRWSPSVAMVAFAALAVAFDANVAANAAPSGSNARKATTASSSVPGADDEFAIKAAQAGMAEVALGKLAQQKAQNGEVKQFGARMVTDHTKANDALEKVADAKHLSLPKHLDKAGQKDLDELGKVNGAKFDRQYIKKQVSGHEKVVAAFEKESKSGHDADLRAFASNMLPTLKDHLQAAQSVEKAVSDEAAQSASSASGLEAAKKATGASRVAVEKQDRMPVPKTGM